MQHFSKQSSAIALPCLAAALLLGLTTGCTTDSSMDMSMSEYTIAMMTPKHFHAFTTTDTLFFQVTNRMGEPKAGLAPMIRRQLKGSSAIYETMGGEVIDNHDGIYYWVTTFLGAGYYVLTFSFDRSGMTYSNAFPIEATYAGGEWIFLPDSATAQVNYQVRWNMLPGAVRGGIDTAAFSVELKRSTNSPVITDKPYTNIFDHLGPSLLVPSGSMPLILVGSASGEDTLTVTYGGVGVYKAKKVLPSVSAETEFWLHVVFTDSIGTIDESGSTNRNYKFTVFPQ